MLTRKGLEFRGAYENVSMEFWNGQKGGASLEMRTFFMEEAE